MIKKKLPSNPKADKEQIDFITESKSALLTRTTPLANVILLTLFFLFVVLLIWAHFAVIDQITIAEAKVIPSSQVKIIQSLDGGIVQEIPVKEGDFVKKGQVVIYLDNTRYKSDYDQTYAKYLALSAAIARLTAETQGTDKIDFPAEVKEKAPELVKSETNLFNTRKKALASEVANLQHTAKLHKEELSIMKPLVDKGIVPKIDYIRADRGLNETMGKILSIKDKFLQEAHASLTEQKAELASVIEALISLKDKMVRTTITSPVNGIVKKINIVTIGGVINPGMAIMEIVPLEDTLLIEAYVKPTDIAFIHPGQKAVVKIKAYDYTVYGDLEGKVEHISADVIEEEQQSANQLKPQQFFLVDIRTDKNYLGSEKHKLPIIPGMTATVHIMTGKHTIMDYLLKPLLKAKSEALREK